MLDHVTMLASIAEALRGLLCRECARNKGVVGTIVSNFWQSAHSARWDVRVTYYLAHRLPVITIEVS